MENSLDKCQEALAKLPRPVEDPSTEVLKLVTNFSSEFLAHVDGLTGHETFVQSNRFTYEQFKNEIRRTAPRFIPFRSKQDAKARRQSFDAIWDDEDSIDPANCITQPMYLEDMKNHIKR